MRTTKRTRRDRPLEVESLESMTLLSGMTSAVTPAAAQPHVSPIIPLPIVVGLKGTVRGVYSSSTFPDVGTTYVVSASGRLAGYGPAAVSGTLHSVGFIRTGQASGTLRVLLPGGTVTVKLTGPPQDGFSPLPHSFTYAITKGTGKYHNGFGDAVGRGTVDVTLKPAPAAVLHGRGQVTLTFTPTPVALA